MRCVSYTRFLSTRKNARKYADAITQQNTLINAYAEKKGWRIIKRYSDKQDDPQAEEAFLKMKQDGMERRFDCLLFTSFARCGVSSYEAFKLLENVFVPAGIRFVCVEDDFDSGEHEAEENHSYLVSKRRSPVNHSEKKEKNVFGKRMIDMNTGEVLKSKRDAETGKICFDHSTGRLTLEEIYDKVRERLLKEKEEAFLAADWLLTEEGQAEKQKAKASVRTEAMEWIQTISRLEQERINQTKQMQEGLITPLVYEERIKELQPEMQEADQRLDACVSKLKELERDYSDKNPWIHLYTKIELLPLPHADWAVMVRRIRQIRITDLSHMEIDLEKLEYRKLFPEKVFSGLKEEETVNESMRGVE